MFPRQWRASSLSSLVLLPLSLLHHARGQQTPNNLRFSTQPNWKSSKIHLPNPSQALCCKIWQKVEGFSHVSVELGCDSSHQMWAEAWSSNLASSCFESSTKWSKFVAPSTHHEFKSMSELLGEFRVRNVLFRHGVWPVRARVGGLELLES